MRGDLGTLGEDLRSDFGGVREFRLLINKQKLIIGEP
jgi:hypothetical protein